jgi:abortive infection bacteriophage resistance protein
MQVYNFDKKLKLLLLGYLEDIEISLRSYIGYVLGSKDIDENASPAYLNSANYCDNITFTEMSKELKSAVSDNKNEAFVKHHNTKYGGVLATWAMVEVMSFGKMSKLLSSLNVTIQKEICNTYYGKRYKIINNWMEGAVVLRNLCAHHARLINRGIVNKPDFTPAEDDYFVSQGYEKNEIGSKVFFRLIIIDRLSHRPKIHEDIKKEIVQLTQEYPFVDLKHYGFKPNWEEIFDETNKDYI